MINIDIDLQILFIANVVTFILYGLDNRLAECGRWRIPEFILLLFAFLGGAFGALCGMILFRHKTKHKVFKICVPLFLCIQLAIEILYRTQLFGF